MESSPPALWRNAVHSTSGFEKISRFVESNGDVHGQSKHNYIKGINASAIDELA
jgi:hypothetical protein